MSDMEYPILTPPSWSERQGYGPQLTYDDMAHLLMLAESTYDLQWRHIHFLATMRAESGFAAWARPMVWAPDKPHHLSVDRGVCALNSYWWAHVDDQGAYEPRFAVEAAVQYIKAHALDGTKGAKVWDWRPLLDWQWHAYGTELYEKALPEARAAVNKVRASGYRLAPI